MVVAKSKRITEDTGTFEFAVKNFFTDYVGWGRARRAEYWWWFLFNILAMSVISMVSVSLSDIWWLATLVPSFCLTVRRLHDTNRSAWNLCWGFLPIIGWIILFVYTCQKGTAGQNKYGAPRF